MPNKTLEKWEEKTIKQLSTLICDGDWIESKNQAPSGIRLIQTGNVGDGYYKDKPENSRYVSEETFEKLNCTEIYSGDCLVSRLPEPLGRACLIPDRNERMITVVDCSIIRFNNKNIIPKYFIYYSMSNSYHNKIIKLSTGSTRQRISRKNLETITVPLPDKNEQQRIVGILDEAFENIEKAKQNALQNLNNSKELFESYIEQIFISKNIGTILSIEEIAQIKGGKRVPKGYKLVSNKTKHPYVRVSDFNDYGSIDLKDIHYIDDYIYEQIKNYTISTKDLYISIAGTIGKAGIVPNELDGANLTENACKLIFKPDIYNKYVYYFTKTKSFINQAIGNTRIAAVPKLALTRLATIKLPIPPIHEQQKIVAQLDELQEQTKKLERIYEQKIKDLDELKQSILQKAFNGEL